MGPVILLRRPPDWAEHEKPALPGSPAMVHHENWVRVCYGLIAVLILLVLKRLRMATASLHTGGAS